MAQCCAPSTMGKRATVWRHWMKFVHESNYTVPLIRPTELHICLWLVWLFKKQLAFSTVQSYLYSLASEIRLRGGRNILHEDFNWFVHSTLKYYQRSKGNITLIYRRPLTVDLLNKLLGTLDFSDYDTRVYGTMLTVGVYCLLRIGELCVLDRQMDKVIRNVDLAFKSGFIELTLWNTKTDKDKKGVKKWLVRTDAKFCPYELVQKLKVIKLHSVEPREPFFVLKNGKAVTKYLLVKFLQQHMVKMFPTTSPKEWSGISLRKGGATSALRAGISGEVIQKMGNWRSTAYKSYIDHSMIDVSTAQRQMATMFPLS